MIKSPNFGVTRSSWMATVTSGMDDSAGSPRLPSHHDRKSSLGNSTGFRNSKGLNSSFSKSPKQKMMTKSTINLAPILDKFKNQMGASLLLVPTIIPNQAPRSSIMKINSSA